LHRPIIKTRARIVKPPGTWLVGLSTFHLAQRTWCYDVIKAFFVFLRRCFSAGFEAVSARLGRSAK
jgi:hypothetical protein